METQHLTNLLRATEKLTLEHIYLWNLLSEGEIEESILDAVSPFWQTFEDWDLAVAGLAESCRLAGSPDFLVNLVMDLYRLAYLCSMGHTYSNMDSLRDPILFADLQPRPSETLRKSELLENIATPLPVDNLLLRLPELSTIVLGDNTLTPQEDGDLAPSANAANRFEGDWMGGARGALGPGFDGPALGGIAGVSANGTMDGDPWTVFGVPLDELGRVYEREWTKGDLLGDGNFGEVYKVTIQGHEMAAKRFKSTDAEPFMRELYFNARLRHPGIVEYRGYFQTSRSKFLFMELLRYSYNDFMDKFSTPAVPINVRIRWALQVATAVRYLHELNIVHRDLNPKNLLMSNNFTLKLCDFTFMLAFETKAKKYSRQDGLEIPPVALRTKDLFAATPRYMSPEIAAKECQDYEASDIWSLGMTILAILTGKRPMAHLTTADGMKGYLIPKYEAFKAKKATTTILTDEKHNPKTIPGMPDAPESYTLVENLAATVLVDPSKRPSAAKLVEDFCNYEKFLRSSAYRKTRESLDQPRLPTLSNFPRTFSTFPEPTFEAMLNFNC